MYKRSLGEAFRKENAKPHHLMHRAEETERFSSFESPPLTDKDNEEFSDFETSREKDKCRVESKSSCKKHKSNILVEQMPLQCDQLASTRKKQDLCTYEEKDRNVGRASHPHKSKVSSSGMREGSSQLKQNCPLRYNYMQKVERHLSTIQQDVKEDLRDSAFRSIPRSFLPAKATPFDVLDDILANHNSKLYQDPNIALLEKQRLEMLMLEQQNISLRERVLILEKELRVRNDERIRKQAQIIAERISNAAHDNQINSTRKEAKVKLVEEVAVLQARCREMKEQMRKYKQKQDQTFARLTQEREDAKLEVIRLKTTHQYQAKFTEMFLNMVEKLPVDLEEEWSDKRKIAVGWKVVKHLVKKAFKLGIHPPAIAQKDHS